jgi:hypothetical protein
MPIEDIKRLVEIALMALAAAWGVVGFLMLKQRQKAIADVRKIDLEAKRLELDLRQTANIEVQIVATSQPDCTGTGFLVLAEVTLSNVGSRDTRIVWAGRPAAFSVRLTTFNAQGQPQFESPAVELRTRQARDPNIEPVSTVVRAKGKQRLTYAARVPEAGLYLLAFRGTVEDREAEVSVEAGAQKANPMAWTGTKFLAVAALPSSHARLAG